MNINDTADALRISNPADARAAAMDRAGELPPERRTASADRRQEPGMASIMTLMAQRVAELDQAVAVLRRLNGANLLQAVIECAHKSDFESVALYRDPKKPGSALTQLADRMAEAARGGAV